MKIVVIHGDNTNESYKRLSQYFSYANKKGWETVRLDKNTGNLIEQFRSTSLFPQERLFILEGFTAVDKKTFTWLNTNGKDVEGRLVIYHDKTLTATALKALKNPEKIESFPLPKVIWTLLDSLYPGNSKVCLKLLHQALEAEAPEFVFAVIGKHFRDLLWVRHDSHGMNVPTWRKGKLTHQAGRFTESSLKEVFFSLAKIDILTKTSKANLAQMLDFTFVKYLQ